MVNEANSSLNLEEVLSQFNNSEESLLNQGGLGDESNTVRYGFIIENMGFLIAENTLSEIAKNAKIYPIPKTKDWMKGLINLRGNLIPVYNFSLLLGLSEENVQQNNLLILGDDSESVGILIDGLPQPCNIENWIKLDKIPCEISSLKEFATEAYSVDDIIWIDFDQKEYFRSIKGNVEA